MTDVLLDGLNLPYGCLDHEHRRPNHGLTARGANGFTNLSMRRFTSCFEKMYRRQFSDEKTRRRLQRLDHRLPAITRQLHNIAAPKK
jgi:hypothetical protein